MPKNNFHDAVIITICKKEDREVCDDYRSISLPSIASKIFARILLNRLLILAETSPLNPSVSHNRHDLLRLSTPAEVPRTTTAWYIHRLGTKESF